MTREDKADITIVSGKGQVVIPQDIRKKLGITTRTKLLVYGYKDAVIMKKMNVPDVVKDLQNLYKKLDTKITKFGELSEKEIDNIIQSERKRQKKEKNF